MPVDLDTSKITEWRSIITLVVYLVTNLVVLFPFHIPLAFPRSLSLACVDTLSAWRIISQRRGRTNEQSTRVRFEFPLNFITAPLIANLLLLAVGAIGRRELHDGILGVDNISPIDIMTFFITVAYIAMSIDASGLIRWLPSKVLQRGGSRGRRLFLILYVFFFVLGSLFGNDPIILSGTAFLAYLTRLAKNISHPRAWTYSQFAIANIASAILVSSNPTNLVLAGAFSIRFITYTANMIVPVVGTAAVLFPCLLYLIFKDETLIPRAIQLHEVSGRARTRKPFNPNIPFARRLIDANRTDLTSHELEKLASFKEVLNPFVDKWSAAVGVTVMAATLIILLALNATSSSAGALPVYWVTLPAATVQFCWDLASGWYHRMETRQLARQGSRKAKMDAAAQATEREPDSHQLGSASSDTNSTSAQSTMIQLQRLKASHNCHGIGAVSMGEACKGVEDISSLERSGYGHLSNAAVPAPGSAFIPGQTQHGAPKCHCPQAASIRNTGPSSKGIRGSASAASTHALSEQLSSLDADRAARTGEEAEGARISREPVEMPWTVSTLVQKLFARSRETFPTAMTVITHLPWALIPFSFAMFILVQALATKGWVPVFAHGWDRISRGGGTVGSIAAMGLISVSLCNFAGTNIGTTILLSRVVQAWQDIRQQSGTPISDRLFWATVYSMALGVNYGAFSTAFSASLAGLLWRAILARKRIHVRSREFARVNAPIIAVSMAVGCAILIGEVYLFRSEKPYDMT